jgi:hypothetical protein
MNKLSHSFSQVPNDYIDDFIDAPQMIDIEIAVKWLRSNKSKIKQKLLRSYILDEDYTINPIKVNRKQIIIISYECFIKLCQKSRTRAAHCVLKYAKHVEKMHYSSSTMPCLPLTTACNLHTSCPSSA